METMTDAEISILKLRLKAVAMRCLLLDYTYQDTGKSVLIYIDGRLIQVWTNEQLLRNEANV